MKNKEKGSFFGFTSVFSFTAKQNMKGKGFALSSIGIGILIFAICLAIPVIMAFVQKPDDAESDDYGIEEDFSENDLDAIVVLDHYGIDKNLLTDFLQLCGFENTEVEFSDLNVDDAYGDFAKYDHFWIPVGSVALSVYGSTLSSLLGFFLTSSYPWTSYNAERSQGKNSAASAA